MTHRPRALRKGDEVMLVSPSGPARPDRVARGVELLTQWGLRVVTAPHVYAREGYLAGTDDQRVADLNLALRDPRIRAVICTRGGYGVQRIVDGVDLAAVRADAKVVVGFSDITALHLALWRGARLATVYGPGAAWRDERTGPASAESLRQAIMTAAPLVVRARVDEGTSVLRWGGAATGTLLGGNLCLLAASVGTVDMPDLHGAILLLEEVAEPPYKVDRMLVHLRRAGALDGLAGVALGQFTAYADGTGTPPADPGSAGGRTVSVVDVLHQHLGRLGVPVLGGLPIGHGPDPMSVPLGVTARLDPTAGTLTAAAATGQTPDP